MGTIVVIDVYAEVGLPGVDGTLATANAVLHQADRVFSTWRPDSAISRLRRGEITAYQVPPEVTEVLRLCAVARDLSGGPRPMGDAGRS